MRFEAFLLLLLLVNLVVVPIAGELVVRLLDRVWPGWWL